MRCLCYNHGRNKTCCLPIYIDPSNYISINDTQSLCNNFRCAMLILCDFNAHNVLWGSPFRDRRGSATENLLLNANLCVLNDGSPTHFSTRSTFTHIDLSLASAQLRPFFSWEIDSQLHGSDHFPIYIEFSRLK